MKYKEYPFEGLVVIPAHQHYEMLKAAAESGAMIALEAFTKQTAPGLPDEMTARAAAKMCGYKSAKTLVTYHFDGLTPIRKGKRLFYSSGEVVKLKLKLGR